MYVCTEGLVWSGPEITYLQFALTAADSNSSVLQLVSPAEHRHHASGCGTEQKAISTEI